MSLNLKVRSFKYLKHTFIEVVNGGCWDWIELKVRFVRGHVQVESSVVYSDDRPMCPRPPRGHVDDTLSALCLPAVGVGGVKKHTWTRLVEMRSRRQSIPPSGGRKKSPTRSGVARNTGSPFRIAEAAICCCCSIRSSFYDNYVENFNT